jgi:hypothetical protein
MIVVALRLRVEKNKSWIQSTMLSFIDQDNLLVTAAAIGVEKQATL